MELNEILPDILNPELIAPIEGYWIIFNTMGGDTDPDAITYFRDIIKSFKLCFGKEDRENLDKVISEFDRRLQC